MKVTWYKGSKLGNFDDSDKILVAKMLKKGWSPNKPGAKKVEAPKKVEPPKPKEQTHG